MKIRYFFLIILLFAGMFIIFLFTPSRLDVLVILLKGKKNLIINNDVYNGISLFRNEHGKSVKIIIREVENAEEALDIIKDIHPDFIVSAVHKPEFEKILSNFKDEYEKFINIFPFYECSLVRNLTPSFEDFSLEVVKFLKNASIFSVSVFSDGTHITSLILNYLKKELKRSKIEIKKKSNFYLFVFNDVLKADSEISSMTTFNRGEGIVVTIHPIRFYEFYGKYIKDLYVTFPKYFFTDEGRSFVEKYRTMFKNFPDWPAILVYDVLSMIEKYGKDVEKIVKYNGIAGEYNFAETSNLFVIKKFGDLKVR